MEAEKSIVNLWLEGSGFLTINDINAGKSVIDIIAIRLSEKGVEKAQHVEVSCSLKGELPASEYLKRFEGAEIKNKISEVLKKYASRVSEWENVLVTNADIPRGMLGSIKVVPFSHALSEVMERIDTQNYQSNIKRALQLIKYTYLKPELIRNIGGRRFKRELKSIAIEHLTQDEMIKQLCSDESSVDRILRKSKLRNDPKKLGAMLKHMLTIAERKALSEEVMTAEQRARRKKVKEKKLSSFYR
ncbi:hypothetical protein COT07_00990 [Candidatus Woesearchaeota archaeon CG07_land_8_20_14_0_80_44_23]|nr:MAG: hypothetical protein COT07_00990 [Candidatus Woesearchaeota archaeon CG07_land_8_20_14_0_80_44_23]